MHKIAQEMPRIAEQIAYRNIARDSESIVGVLKFWRDAGAGGAAGDFDLVAP